tara:strand:- start:1370 stop:1834 length:465 start_codon:yes stop_codon:yes gene_type:complete
MNNRKLVNLMEKKKKQKNEDAPAVNTSAIPNPADTAMGPRFTTTNVIDRRKKLPALLKRFQLQSFKRYMEAEEIIAEDNMSTIRNIVKRKQFGKIKLKDGQAVIDMFTASAILNAIDKRLNKKNVEKVKDMINNGTKNQLMKLVSVVMHGDRAI